MLRSAGSPRELEVREGSWSDWLRVKFKVGLLQSVRGIVRFHLVRLEPELRALRLAGQLRPRGPALPDQRTRRTTPGSWPRRSGPFHTTGMVEDHAGLNNERFGEEAFLDQCDQPGTSARR